MTKIALLAGAVSMLVLGACSNAELIKQVELTKPTGTNFNKSLYNNYVKLAKAEENEGDLGDAKHFIMKAKAAAAGQSVQPDGLPPRDVTGTDAKEITAVRPKLIKALSGKKAKAMPDVAAEAQTSFDCWIQEAEEGIQQNDIAACRKAFDVAMAKLGTAKKKKRSVASGSPFTVYFKFDKAALTKESEGALYDIMQKVRLNKPKKVHIIAYTDLSGKNPYNDKLAEMRAQDLAKKIKSAGAKVVTTAAPGAKDPVVDTKKPNQTNRRAIIIFAK
jgi:outer membrane protein OmpA-like peptidoglycan-associated protein